MPCSIELRIALAVSNATDREYLRRQLTHYAIATENEVDFAHIGNDFSTLLKRIAKYDLVIADEKVLKANVDQLHNIYLGNPECLTVLTGMESQEVCRYLALRPCGYISSIRDDTSLRTIFDMQIKHRMKDDSVLQIHTRDRLFAVTVSEILYCQSELKYVIITTVDGERYRRLGKLDDLMAALPASFQRVHQSYVINKTRLRSIDKSTHELVLQGGVKVPYSRIYTKEVYSIFQY